MPEATPSHKITKPIQLLSAWLVGLTAIDASFLGAAISLRGTWESQALVIGAIANVYVFIFALFLLQTRFRAELQEDSYYSEYLSKKTNSFISVRQELPTAATASRLDFQLESKPAGETDWKIAINQQLEQFSEIKEGLQVAGIPVNVIFGNDKPAINTVAISYYMPFEYKIQLLKVLVNYPLDRLITWEPMRDAYESEDVYIGSYGESDYIALDQEFKEFIETDIDRFDYQRYENNNLIRIDKP